MRFSSIFQLRAVPAQPAAAAEAEAAARATVEPAATATPPLADLPDDLDARVRLVGEWQFGED